MARNVAASLDYQFGFEVSEVWFYRFLERTLIPFAVVMLAAFWLLSTIVVVNPEENGIRERFGRVATERALMPGLHFKLPWPFARIYRFPVERVQMVPIGYKEKGKGGEDGHDHEEETSPEDEGLQGDPTGRVILWSKMHGKEELSFVVACAPADSFGPGDAGTEDDGDAAETSAVPAAYFLSASIPLYFKVTDLYSYGYRHAEPRETLTRIATREVVRYLANVDLFDIMTSGREESGEVLKQRIQDAANKHQLGIEVVFLGLQGLHPPVRVGAAFDRVVAAMEEKHEQTLLAEAYNTRTVSQAQADAYSETMSARGYKEDQIRVPKTRAERFEKQLSGYNAEPDVFMLRTFLDVLQTETADTRKYIIAHSSGRDVIVLDLQQKQRLDLLDIELDRADESEEQGDEE